jgi:hypothetical protein
MYYLKYEHAGVLNTTAQPECFISDKTRTASVLNGLKTTHLMRSLPRWRSDFKNKRCLSRENQS